MTLSRIASQRKGGLSTAVRGQHQKYNTGYATVNAIEESIRLLFYQGDDPSFFIVFTLERTVADPV